MMVFVSKFSHSQQINFNLPINSIAQMRMLHISNWKFFDLVFFCFANNLKYN